MKPKFLSDARLIPDEVMDYLRKIAVHAIEENHYSPENVIKIFGFSRSVIYEWLRRFREEGYEGLETKKAPGASPIITEEMDACLKRIVLEATPEDYGYDAILWTCDLLAHCLSDHFGVTVKGSTINHHLHQLGLTNQKPNYIPSEQNLREVDDFVNKKFPKIQRFANTLSADIGFEDEAGIDLREHSGKTWGESGVRPSICVTGKRGHFNVLSIVTAKGELKYHVNENKINSKEYIKFLTQLIKNRVNPLFLIVDRASFHTSKKVRIFIWRNRRKIRLFYLPAYSPEINPDEHVWEEIKDKRLRRKPITSKIDLKKRLHSALKSLQHHKDRIISFFHLPDTRYAA